MANTEKKKKTTATNKQTKMYYCVNQSFRMKTILIIQI